jgi:hypothetical protein
MGKPKTLMESRAKGKFSRVIQITLSGKKLKHFDEERAREVLSESELGRDLLTEALQRREHDRTHRNKSPFFT